MRCDFNYDVCAVLSHLYNPADVIVDMATGMLDNNKPSPRQAPVVEFVPSRLNASAPPPSDFEQTRRESLKSNGPSHLNLLLLGGGGGGITVLVAGGSLCRSSNRRPPRRCPCSSTRA